MKVGWIEIEACRPSRRAHFQKNTREFRRILQRLHNRTIGREQPAHVSLAFGAVVKAHEEAMPREGSDFAEVNKLGNHRKAGRSFA